MYVSCVVNTAGQIVGPSKTYDWKMDRNNIRNGNYAFRLLLLKGEIPVIHYLTNKPSNALVTMTLIGIKCLYQVVLWILELPGKVEWT